MSNPKPLVLTEACALVGVGETTLRRLIRAGDVKARQVKRGKRAVWLVDRDSLLARFGALDAPDVGPGARVIRAARHAAAATAPASEPGEVVAMLRERVSAQEHELAGLRDELRQARVKLDELRDRLEAKDAELRALLTAPRAGALVRLVRDVRGALSELRSTRS